ncbi:MAG TPA: N-acetylmuramoyl-L-alanine amidase [Chloroflexota bacterium]|nr:N-acetylmuramoyl-L-alanine amidase [Chloroflexota bacterium]
MRPPYLAVSLVAAILLALVLPRALVASQSLNFTGHSVEVGEWLPLSFTVAKGETYVAILTPHDDDADLYFYDPDGNEIGRGVKVGTAQDSVTWTSDRNGTAVAWVHGAGEAPTSFVVSIDGPPSLAYSEVATIQTVANSQVAAANAAYALRSGMRVGLQAGHWRRHEATSSIRNNTGSSGGGFTEEQVTLSIARLTASRLSDLGYKVDVLPTVIPRGYEADVVISIHTDGGPASRRGFFADRAVRSLIPTVDDRLVRLLNQEHAAATGIPHVYYGGTVGTKYYYGYGLVAPRTPMALIETGFLTNAVDRAIIAHQPDRVAAGLTRALDRFLTDR